MHNFFQTNFLEILEFGKGNLFNLHSWLGRDTFHGVY